MYKKKIIFTIVSFVLTMIVYFLVYIQKSESSINELSSLFVIFLFILILFILYWLFEITKYAFYRLMFGSFKKLSLVEKIINIAICVILFIFTAFVYLIDYPKFITLEEKLNEKNMIRRVRIFDRKKNIEVKYNSYDFSKDKLFTYFYIEYDLGIKPKKYLIYKTDKRYQLLKAYAVITNDDDKDNKMALHYLQVSYSAIKFYKNEVNALNKNYEKKVEEYKSKIGKEDDSEYQAMLNIQNFLMTSKMNNLKYNEVVKVMQLGPEFRNLEDVKMWHNYFINETDKESEKVSACLSKLNDRFKNEILVKYQDKKNTK